MITQKSNNQHRTPKNPTDTGSNSKSMIVNLKNMSDDALENSTIKAVRTERKIIHIVLTHLLELENRKVHEKYGYDGIYTYMTKKLGYSAPAASIRNQALKLLRSAPQVLGNLENGSVCLSQMVLVQKCVTQAREAGNRISAETTLKVLHQIENKTVFESNSIIAKEFDLPVITSEVIKPQKNDTVRVELYLSLEAFKELQQAKELLSHICHTGNLGSVIEHLAKNFNRQKLQGRTKKITQVAVASDVTRPEFKEAKSQTLLKEPGNSRTPFKPKRQREYISLTIRRALLARAGNCCEYTDGKSGHRCASRYQLQVDHIIPWSLGGSNKIENLRILCRSHNLKTASIFKSGAPL